MAPKLSSELQQTVIEHAGGPIELEGEGLSCVLMSVDVYRSLLGELPDSDQDLAECVAGIHRGLAAMERGEGIPLNVALESVRRKLQIPVDA